MRRLQGSSGGIWCGDRDSTAWHFASWNCAGVGQGKLTELLSALDVSGCRPHVIALQETRNILPDSVFGSFTTCETL